jgi:hypothetical protein
VEYEIEEKDLKAPGKYRKHSEARGVVAWLPLEMGTATLSELSGFAGSDQVFADCMAELKHCLNELP